SPARDCPGVYGRLGVRRRLAATLLAASAIAALGGAVFAKLMALHPAVLKARPRRGIGMRIRPAIYPRPLPRTVVDDDLVTAPAEGRPSPAPGGKRADHDARAEGNRAANEEPGPRARINDVRVVVRHVDVAGVHGKDFDVARSGVDHANLT